MVALILSFILNHYNFQEIVLGRIWHENQYSGQPQIAL